MAAAPSRRSRAIRAPSRSPSSCSPRTRPPSTSPKPSRQAARVTKPSPSSCAACSSASPSFSSPVPGRESISCQVFEIHVATGQDHAHGADVFRQLAEQDGGGGDGAARLHQDLQAQEKELDGGAK